MSRLERTIEKRSKKKKFRVIGKILFIGLLFINIMVCIVTVDLNAKSMLGKDIQIDEVLEDSKLYLRDAIKNINKLATNIVGQFNK